MAAVLDLISNCAVTLTNSSSLRKYKRAREKANPRKKWDWLCISCNEIVHFGVNYVAKHKYYLHSQFGDSNSGLCKIKTFYIDNWQG